VKYLRRNYLFFKTEREREILFFITLYFGLRDFYWRSTLYVLNHATYRRYWKRSVSDKNFKSHSSCSFSIAWNTRRWSHYILILLGMGTGWRQWSPLFSALFLLRYSTFSSDDCIKLWIPWGIFKAFYERLEISSISFTCLNLDDLNFEGFKDGRNLVSSYAHVLYASKRPLCHCHCVIRFYLIGKIVLQSNSDNLREGSRSFFCRY